MTAYDLFKRAYYHYTGAFMRHLWATNKDRLSPKAYTEQSFARVLCEYGVVYALNNGFRLEYNDNLANKDIQDLKQIKLKAGYWLCNYDGHTGEWLFMHYDNRNLAKAAYRQLYMRYFRHQEWFWIVKIDHRG